MTTPLNDLTPKERELKNYLDHLVGVHGTADLIGIIGCQQCDKFKEALK